MSSAIPSSKNCLYKTHSEQWSRATINAQFRTARLMSPRFLPFNLNWKWHAQNNRTPSRYAKEVAMMRKRRWHRHFLHQSFHPLPPLDWGWEKQSPEGASVTFDMSAIADVPATPRNAQIRFWSWEKERKRRSAGLEGRRERLSRTIYSGRHKSHYQLQLQNWLGQLLRRLRLVPFRCASAQLWLVRGFTKLSLRRTVSTIKRERETRVKAHIST